MSNPLKRSFTTDGVAESAGMSKIELVKDFLLRKGEYQLVDTPSLNALRIYAREWQEQNPTRSIIFFRKNDRDDFVICTGFESDLDWRMRHE
jgi:hypothetical protein